MNFPPLKKQKSKTFRLTAVLLNVAYLLAGFVQTADAQGQNYPETQACHDITARIKDLIARSKHQQALPIAEHAIRKYKTCARAYLQKGLILVELDRPAEAIPFLRNGFKLAPKFNEKWAWEALAQTLYETNKQQEAIETLTNALNYVSHKPPIYDTRGRMHAEMQHFDLAIKDFTQQINSCSDKSECDFRSRAMTYLRMKQYEKAIIDFNSQIKSNPQSIDYMSRARAYKGLGKIKEANSDIAKGREMSTATGLEDL